VVFDPSALAHGQFAAHEATHLGQHPAAFLVLRPADRPVGMGVEVLRAQAVPRTQRYDAHTVGAEPEVIGYGSRSRALDGGPPKHLLIALGQACEGHPHQGAVDARTRVVCRGGRRRRLQGSVFGRDGAQLATGVIDGDGAHGGQEIGAEVGQGAFTGLDEVIDPQTRLRHDVLSGRASAVTVRDGIRGGQVATPQLGVGLGIAPSNQPQEGDVVSLRPGLPPDLRLSRHDETLPSTPRPRSMTDVEPLCL